MPDPGTSGRCLCGAVRFRTQTPPVWTALCHCESCRRACSAPVVAWMGFGKDDVAWAGDLTFFRSSKSATRGFCSACGTPMSFESTRWPGEIHLYAVSQDDPTLYQPDLHCHAAERVPWLTLHDDLPVFPGSAGASHDREDSQP